MLQSFLKVVSHIHVCSTYTAMAGFHTEFKGGTIMLGGGLGTCSVKIMILEVRFLLINFTSAEYSDLATMVVEK